MMAEAKPTSVHLDPAVFGATVQLPAFDKVEAETWFVVADANFALTRVTDPTTKYYYVLLKLDASTLRKLTAFIKQSRGPDPYAEIKDVLCDAYEPSLEQKLDAMLALTDLGDERPKEFGLELKRLASDSTRDDILKRIFVRCLPGAKHDSDYGQSGCEAGHGGLGGRQGVEGGSSDVIVLGDGHGFLGIVGCDG